MAATPIYGLPYQGLGDSPHGPNLGKALAEAIEALIATIKPVTDRFATGALVADQQDTSGSTSATTFTPTLTGGTACGVVFVAPPSGKVLIHNSAFVDNASTPRSYMTFRVRTGSIIGSGTDVVAALDANSVTVLGSDDATVGRAILVDGLTPGQSYNAQQLFKVSSTSTGSFQWKRLIVQPIY